jgi:hypothetical protein
MTVLSIPDPDALILLGVRDYVPDQMNRSAWTSRGQVVGLPGAEMWFIRAAIEGIATEDEECPWRAFVFGLKGRQNTFHFPIACQRHVGGKPLVDTGATDGYTLPLKGMQPSTLILRAGKYMTVPLPSGHHRLVNLSADLVTDAAGKGVATFNFALDEVPALNAIVETANPFVPVRRSEQGEGFSYDNAVSGSAFMLEEAL